MGLKSWIRKKLIGFDPEDAGSVEKLATEYLKTSTKIHSDTLRAAQKINQARLMAQQEKQLREALSDGLGDDNDDDYDDEDDEGQGMTDKIISTALQNMFSGKEDSKPQQPSSSLDRPQNADIKSLRKRAGAQLKNMPDEAIRLMADKGFF